MPKIDTIPRKNMIHRVFVYGSLLSNLSNWHRILKNRSKFIGIAYLDADKGYAMLDGTNGAFPYVVRAADYDIKPTVIKGEVYEVDDKVKADLDALEGVPTHYIPRKDEVRHFATNEKERVLFYLTAITVNNGVQVEDGDWRVYEYNYDHYENIVYRGRQASSSISADQLNQSGFFLSDDDDLDDCFDDFDEGLAFLDDDELSDEDRLDLAFLQNTADVLGSPRNEHRTRFIR